MANTDNFVFVKPAAFTELDSKAIGRVFRADKRVLPHLERLVDLGTEQLKAMSGFDNKHLPKETKVVSPEFSYDDIVFQLETKVSRLNPKYDNMFEELRTFLGHVHYIWQQNAMKQVVITDEVSHGKSIKEEPFIRWDFLMANAMRYNEEWTQLKVSTEPKTTAPADYDSMPLNRLVVPAELVADFKIDRPGAAKIWYLASRFVDEAKAELKAPVEKAMEAKVEAMPEETQHYLEQFGNMLYTVTVVPSERPLSGQVYKRLFAIPEKVRKRGDKSLPVIAGPGNYLQLLADYAPTLEEGLDKWATLEGNIGEMNVIFFGAADHPRARKEYPQLKRYLAQADSSLDRVRWDNPTTVERYARNIWVSLNAVIKRMDGLDEDYTMDRAVVRHTVEKL